MSDIRMPEVDFWVRLVMIMFILLMITGIVLHHVWLSRRGGRSPRAVPPPPEPMRGGERIAVTSPFRVGGPPRDQG